MSSSTSTLGNRLAYELVRPSVPLLVGTWSPRLTSFAAEEADELKLGGCANPAMVALTRERLGDSDTRLVVGAVTVVDEDDDAARAHARRQVALYLPVVAGRDPTVDIDPDVPTDEIPDDVLDLLRVRGRAGAHRRAGEAGCSTRAPTASSSARRTASTRRAASTCLRNRSYRRYARPERAPPAPERATDVMRGSIMRANTSASALSAMIAVALRNMTPRISGRS